MLFNEPKLLKSALDAVQTAQRRGFSALHRAEIAEIEPTRPRGDQRTPSFSALQRAEIAEICRNWTDLRAFGRCVSVLFNEPKLLKLTDYTEAVALVDVVSVLFNEPKLLKWYSKGVIDRHIKGFSALQRAEIAEMESRLSDAVRGRAFQCSSTSRNC